MSEKSEAVIAKLGELARAVRVLRQEVGHTGMGVAKIVLPHYEYRAAKAHVQRLARNRGDFHLVPECPNRDSFEFEGVTIVSGPDF